MKCDTSSGAGSGLLESATDSYPQLQGSGVEQLPTHAMREVVQMAICDSPIDAALDDLIDDLVSMQKDGAAAVRLLLGKGLDDVDGDALLVVELAAPPSR